MSGHCVPVLLDTDIGTNVDDALALAYLLAQPRCELLGVTTVSGEPQTRARLASAVCEAFGRVDVAIHAGSAAPLHGEQRQSDVPHHTVLDRWPHYKDFAPDAAVEFLDSTIRSRPGEITLLSIGPLTNIGRLFKDSPDIPHLLKRHVLMGGAYTSELSETNIRLDPRAAEIVFAADMPAVYCVGVDVSARCHMPMADACALFSYSRLGLRLMREMLQVFAQQRPEVTFNDPLAAASIFQSDLLKYDSGRVEVEGKKGASEYTRFQRGGSPMRHHVASEVAAAAFFQHYGEIVLSQAPVPPSSSYSSSQGMPNSS